MLLAASPLALAKWGMGLTTHTTNVTLHGKTVNKVIAHARHGPNTFARYLLDTLSVPIMQRKTKELE